MIICLCSGVVPVAAPCLQARSTSDVTLLVISKFDYEELVHNYPEQNDIIVTNVLSLFGLDKDGNDSSVSKDAAEDTISEDAKEKLRCALACQHQCSRQHDCRACCNPDKGLAYTACVHTDASSCHACDFGSGVQSCRVGIQYCAFFASLCAPFVLLLLSLLWKAQQALKRATWQGHNAAKQTYGLGLHANGKALMSLPESTASCVWQPCPRKEMVHVPQNASRCDSNEGA